jgi:hypothetical protein
MHDYLLACLLAVQVEVPTFVAVSPESERPIGHLVRLTPGLTATLQAKGGERDVANVISLRRSDSVIPGFPTGPQLVTTAGDRIAGTLVGGDARFLRFRPSGAHLDRDKFWTIPISSAVVIWLTDTPSQTPLDTTRYEWLADVKNQDVLRFRNGDTARGTIDGLESDSGAPKFSFRPVRGDLRSIPAGELAAVAFNPSLARSRKPKGAYTRIVLTDGSRLSLSDPAISKGVLAGTSLFGERVQLRLADVVAIDIFGGSAVFLSDIKPTKVEQVGSLGVHWPLGVDRSVRGDQLRVSTPLGDTAADKGLGMHPRSRVAYDLGGRYKRFEALVGLDPSAPVRTSVVVSVVVDGKEVAINGQAKLSSGQAIEIRIDVTNAKELALVTDFGAGGAVGGEVNWVDARLVK